MKIWSAILVLAVLAGCSSQPAPKPVVQSEPPAPVTKEPQDGMVWIPAGIYLVGSEEGLADEKPTHDVETPGFWMDETEVTVEQFQNFVDATGYETVAEKAGELPDGTKFPPGSLVFVMNDSGGGEWQFVEGASWKHPFGPDSKPEPNHPVVHVAYDDALAYCEWAGKRLPSEHEWEIAARGGLLGEPFVWGQEPPNVGAVKTNVWQGEFPVKNEGSDGFIATAPVKSFDPNGYGLYDMAGNVWEWCSDWYHAKAYDMKGIDRLKGPEASHDPDDPTVAKRVIRGGSYLCSDNYCRGYRPSARMKTSPDTGLSHTGFRCVKD
ncbi:MAG: formylglycine-generating enzyme family protein [Armatimonadetes bacterium]|nr:formylglycine-generating enzyme family protein [Armatimonadota bacterium]